MTKADIYAAMPVAILLDGGGIDYYPTRRLESVGQMFRETIHHGSALIVQLVDPPGYALLDLLDLSVKEGVTAYDPPSVRDLYGDNIPVYETVEAVIAAYTLLGRLSDQKLAFVTDRHKYLLNLRKILSTD